MQDEQATPTVPFLCFRSLEEAEVDLAVSLAADCHGMEDPRSECFGLTESGLPAVGGRAWGLFMREVLSGVIWLRISSDATAEVTGVALTKGTWNMGLLAWMIGELARVASLHGARELRVRVTGGTPALGEALTESGFAGLDPEAEDYPAGEWRRPAFTVGISKPLNN